MRRSYAGLLIIKDLKLLSRDRLMLFITVAMLMMCLAIYFLMPSDTDDSFEMIVHGIIFPDEMMISLTEEGVHIVYAESKDDIRQGIEEGDYYMGAAFPDNLFTHDTGVLPVVDIYFSAQLTPEMRDADRSILKYFLLSLKGEKIDIEVREAILGTDLAGKSISMKKRVIPIIALLILFMEIMGISNLIVDEINNQTSTAILTTPLRKRDFLFAKGFSGLLLAFIQAVIILLITGGFTSKPLLILTVLFLSAILVIAFSLLIASISKDMMSVLSWGILSLIILIFPAFSVIFPGTASGWIKIIPSYYIVNTIFSVNQLGAGWAQTGSSILILLAFDMVILSAGVLTIRRKLT